MLDNELNELLEKNFANVNVWLNFAEVKNGLNATFVSACIVGLFNMEVMNSCIFKMYSICMILSGICSLISFIPNLGKRLEQKNSELRMDEKLDNLIFFEDIKKYSAIEYLKQLSSKYYNTNEYTFSKYQLNLASEIVYNSYIVSNKYKWFKCAIYLDLVAFLILCIAVIFS